MSTQGNYNDFNFQDTVISDRPQDVTFILDYLVRQFGNPPVDGNVPVSPSSLPTEATLLAVLAKLEQMYTTESLEATQQSVLTNLINSLTELTSIKTNTTGVSTSANQVTGNTSLASILAKIIAAPATEAKQDTGNTSLASILAKIIAAPATEAKQDTGNTSLASILAKIIAAPATEAKQDTGNTSLASILAKISQGVISASGNITTQNLVPNGIATAGSAVEITMNGTNAVAVQITGVYTGALSIQATIDGNTWVTIGLGSIINAGSNVVSANIPSATVGIFFASYSGAVKIRVTALAAVTGTAAITINAINSVAPNFTAPINNTAINLSPNASFGSSSTNHLISANTTNATSVKASAGTCGCISISNASGAVRYFKMYNKASAPTVGTDIPVLTVLIPAGATIFVDCGYAGMRFSTGIAYALTTGIADADTGVVGTADLAVNISYT